MPERVNFGKLRDVLDIPDLIGIQIESYKSFLQLETDPKERKNQGLQEVFNEVVSAGKLRQADGPGV